MIYRFNGNCCITTNAIPKFLLNRWCSFLNCRLSAIFLKKGKMDIIDLREAPQHIPTIARWHFDEWGYLNPGRTFEHRLDRMQRYLGDNPIPTMLIAIDGETLLGTAALVESDMDTHPELGPWLASVYIKADQRKRGLGKQLVQALMDFARRQELAQLYLFTPDQSAFYAALGWKMLALESYRDTPVTLMRLDYQPAA
jgi:N-acetylglutamate synthase-like GNAT family acetyltransferase